ncbi:MAG: FAD-dependent oxidoreductase [Dehalococcoidales bacterium]|nr:FAD-dependent oxidoreductase [Dehalococcoidales bacterium]
MAVTKTAEVIIIGAGIIGTSIAYHLAKSGCRDVIILEKEPVIGSGSTAKAAGGVRHQFLTETNVRLSVESIRFFQHFEEEMGSVIDFRQHGYLFLACTDKELKNLQQRLELQRRHGIEVYFLSPGEVKGRLPAINVDDILGAIFGPTDGRVDPYSVVQGYASAAKRLGVKIYTGVESVEIRVSNHRVRGVLSTDGEIEAPVVVNAAGPWAGLVGRAAGIDIPVHPHKKHSFFTAPTDEIRRDAPLIIDLHQDTAVWREGRGIGFNGSDPDQPEGFDVTVDWSCLPKIARRVVPRFPFLADTGIIRAEAGLHPDTADKSAILGDTPELEGLYLACGMNSQGVMHSPAVGRIMAEYILKINKDPAISLLRLSRFKEGALQKE